jgi:mono/diheme cytochrome c family protein
MMRTIFLTRALAVGAALAAGAARVVAAEADLAGRASALIETYCANCHNDVDHEAGLDLTSLKLAPGDPVSFQQWVKVHERLEAGEMPPKGKKRPSPEAAAAFVQTLGAALTAEERANVARAGRATQRRLNGYEYENALRDLFHAPWLQIRGQFPEDGEAHRFNKIGDALDVSHVHLARYMTAADYAIRQVMSVQLERPPTTTTRYYARDQRTLTSKFTPNIFNSSPDRMTYPVVDTTAQPEVRLSRAPVSVGAADPALRDREAVGWVSSNYVTGFTYRWDGFRAPVAGRYRIRFNGYTLWAAPGGVQMRFAGEKDTKGTPRPPNPNVPDYDRISAGRRDEPITVYTRNGVMNRRVGSFDLTPEPAVHDVGEVWLLANETLVPDASRFYRSRPNNFRNPLMTPEGAPSVAFRWMEVEGPLYDDATTAGYRRLFGDLPLRRAKPGPGRVTVPVILSGERREGGRNAGRNVVPLADVPVEVDSTQPRADAERLLGAFLERVYRRKTDARDTARFLALFDDRMRAGLGFTEAMVACYTAVLASPAFVFLDEKPGPLEDEALATRLALFLWNSVPDDNLRTAARRGELRRPEVLRAQTERLLADPKSQRFVEAFLDYWIDLRKIEDTTPSTTLYNDYYLDDALTEAALAETQLFFADLLRQDLPANNLIASDFTYLNERLATHYGLDGVKGAALRRVPLPADGVRGGLMTQASILKVTANGTTTSPVLRGKWVVERILGIDVPPPPASVPAVEPDIRGAVTIRQQLDRHRADASCASCHRKMDPAGFALENFDVMGAWRDRYRGSSPETRPEKGLGKNGQPFAFHFGLPVDAAGELPDGRPFANIREFKQLLAGDERPIARNLVKQLAVYATGAPIRFSDRAAIDDITARAKAGHYGVRRIVHEIVQSPLFREK